MNRLIRIAPVFLLVAAAGCGAKAVPVKGVVKFDGQPVEGATVTFVSPDGKESASGFTDAGGNFELTHPSGQSGAMPGEYKVVVVKAKKVAGGESMGADSKEYMEAMKKQAAESAKAGKKADAGEMMKAKMMGKGGPVPGDAASGEKSELPAAYASAKTTPITVKVPPESQPVQIDLKK